MRKVKFGIIGTNSISEWFINGALLDERFIPYAILSRDYDRGLQFACKYSIERVFTNLGEMLSEIDALYIASPNSIHFNQAKIALENRVPVLCEKPICSNTLELQTLLDTSKRYNTPLMEAMISTLNPNFLTLRNNIDRVGIIRKYFSSYCQYSSRYDKFKSGIVENAFKLELSNGALRDIGIYTIYPMVVLFGMPISISVEGELLNTGVDACGSILFKYNNGVDATVIYSKIYDSDLPTQVIGEDGFLVLDKINTPRKLYLKQRKNDAIDISANHCGDDYFYEVKEFIDMIEKGAISHEINSHSNSLIVLKIIDQIRKKMGIVYPTD